MIWPGNHIQTKVISDTNCTRLEIEAVLLGLESFLKRHSNATGMKVYTDCKNICDLPLRRARLEENHFLSKKSGLELNNADLYRKFFAVYDDLKPKMIWTKGHLPTNQKTEVQKTFSQVDKHTRRQLRVHVLNELV